MPGETETVLPASQEMSDEASATGVGNTFSEERETLADWESIIRQAIAESGSPGSLSSFLAWSEVGMGPQRSENMQSLYYFSEIIQLKFLTNQSES